MYAAIINDIMPACNLLRTIYNLHQFFCVQDTTGRLAEALAAIPKFNLQLPEDVNEDVEHLQGQLKRLTYRVGCWWCGLYYIFLVIF